MPRRAFVTMMMGVLIAVAPVVSAPAQSASDEQQTVEAIRRALMRLPYYGVFDFLAFRYDKGTVTLSGYAYRPLLKTEAANAVRRVARVDEVIDEIEILPLSDPRNSP